MSKHTPAPWSADRVWDIPESKVHAYCCGEPYAVAEIYGMPGPGEREANARLIAAAPDLLAALQTTAGNIRSLGPAGALDQVPMEFRVWLDVVDAAIAKAITVR